jgi:DNA processing protein
LIELENKLKYYDYNSKSESVKENISDLNESEKKIFKVLDHQAVNINKINELSGLSISECLVNLLSLEIKGLIKQVSGKNFIKL